MNSDIKKIPVIDRREDASAQDAQIRLSLSFEEAYKYEEDTVLGEAYRFWRDAREGSNKAPFSGLLEKRETLSRQARASTGTVIDVSAEDPLHFFFKDQILRTPFGCNKGLRLIDLPTQIIRDALLLEFARAKESAQPGITEVHQWRHPLEPEQKNISRHYIKIDLPVIDQTTGEVNYILIVSRLIEENIVGLPRRLVNSELIR